MKKNILYFSALILFAGCSSDKEQTPPQGETINFEASTESVGRAVYTPNVVYWNDDRIDETRTNISDTGAITWRVNDQVGISPMPFNAGTNGLNTQYQTATAAASVKFNPVNGAIYTGLGSNFAAYYPYNQNLTVSAQNQIVCSVPAVQRTVSLTSETWSYVDRSFMVATAPVAGNNVRFQFRSIFAVFHLGVPYGGFFNGTVTQVQLTSPVAICGDGVYNFSNGEMTVSATTGTTVTLNLSEYVGVGDFPITTYYDFSILPISAADMTALNAAGGMTVTIRTSANRSASFQIPPSSRAQIAANDYVKYTHGEPLTAEDFN